MFATEMFLPKRITLPMYEIWFRDTQRNEAINLQMALPLCTQNQYS
jgi:hypothetical protein